MHFIAWVLACGLLLAFGVRDVVAQDPAPPLPPQLIDSIVVEGNSRLREAEIVAFSGLQLFQPVNYRGIQRAITNLYQSGQFDDVFVEQRGDEATLILAIIVKERPTLRRWRIEGAKTSARRPPCWPRRRRDAPTCRISAGRVWCVPRRRASSKLSTSVPVIW
jgi:hypothetical protein